VSLDGDKLSEIHSQETGPDAGLAGFIEALDVDKGDSPFAASPCLRNQPAPGSGPGPG